LTKFKIYDIINIEKMKEKKNEKVSCA
jgi:hypothetical protein